MHQPNVHEVRDNIALYLDAAARGEEVLICRRNQPVARLVAISQPVPRDSRPIGQAPDSGVALPDAFWDPLPALLIGALSGHDSAALPPGPAPR